MEAIKTITDLLGNTDIYLIDQIMKGRYAKTDKILDAGCGEGRNMHWFIKNQIKIFGIDSNKEAILNLKIQNPVCPPLQLQVSLNDNLPFENHYFDHVISSAVLHFANSVVHFKAMISEMHRVLKVDGTLFIRMTSDIGIEDKVSYLGNGCYELPDGSVRFLLTRNLLEEIKGEYSFDFLEPLKTVNVDDLRCMSTLVLQKK